uniref:Putative secreted protein n=1 Tax=Ixodes ricinus TaxID=34613 RepID=A0A6B0TWL6_IXORI
MQRTKQFKKRAMRNSPLALTLVCVPGHCHSPPRKLVRWSKFEQKLLDFHSYRNYVLVGSATLISFAT